MELSASERLDIVNENLSLIQKKDGLTFGTDALLLSAYISASGNKGLEIGGGTGVISMLLLTRGKINHADVVEVQADYAELISKNAELNNLSEKITSVNKDIREFSTQFTYDIVYTNPPYMKTVSGKANQNDGKNAARHEIFGDIRDFCAAGKRLTRFGGIFAVVYRPDRLGDLLFAMKENLLEPKRITFVHADADAEASMVLIEARRGGGIGTYLTKPLLIYTDKTHTQKTSDMIYIEENGSFPALFIKRSGK